jgi:hypothetical protein
VRSSSATPTTSRSRTNRSTSRSLSPSASSPPTLLVCSPNWPARRDRADESWSGRSTGPARGAVTDASSPNPSDTARFPNRRALKSLGARHGRCNLRAGLYAPAVVPGIELWSSALEHFGRRVIPWFGAFQANCQPRSRATSPRVHQPARREHWVRRSSSSKSYDAGCSR